MNRIEVVWCEKPDKTDDPEQPTNSIVFRVTDEWIAVDQDQLLLSITLLKRDGNELEEPQPSILKQYGGESVLNSMLLEEQDLDVGSEWKIERTPTRRTIRPH